MSDIFVALGILSLIYFGALTVGCMILLLASLPYISVQFQEKGMSDIEDILGVVEEPILTVIIPCFNEKERVINSVLSVMNGTFKLVNIIIVDDASTDNTLQIMKDWLDLYEVPPVIKQTIQTKPIFQIFKSSKYPNISVISKEHGYGNGADSVNVGVNAATTPLFMTLDADTVVEPDAISRLLFAFFSKPHCISVGGAVYVLNEIPVKDGKMATPFLPHKLVPAFQSIEYIRSFIFGRAGFNPFGGALCYAGAFSMFEKQAILEVGGYDPKNFSYDAEITVKLHDYFHRHKYPYTAYFASNAFAWTLVPPTIKSYWRQRDFWQRGLIKTFMLHKKMLFNPRYGWVGLFNVPFNLFFEILAPVFEFIAYIMVLLSFLLSSHGLEAFILSLAVAIGFSALLNLANFFLNILTYKKYNKPRDILRVFYLVFIEVFGFRQIRAACCTYATCKYFWRRLRGEYI